MADRILSPEEVAYRARYGQDTLQGGRQMAQAPRHWAQALAGALQMGLGGHYGANAAFQEKEGKARANSMLAEALMGNMAPKDAASKMLADPWAADAGRAIAARELDPMTGLQRQKAQLMIDNARADAALNPLRRQKLEMEIGAARSAQEQRRMLNEMFFGSGAGAQPPEAAAPTVEATPATGVGRFAAPQMAASTPSAQTAPQTMTPRQMLAAQPPDVQAAFKTLWLSGDQKGAMELLTRRDPGRDAISKEFVKADLGTVKDYRTAADDANSLTGKLDRLEMARSQAKGNFITPGPVSNVLPSWSAAAQMVDSAATEIQLEFTKQTKGAITEREMALFANATPGWQMTDAAAQPVIDAMRVAANRAKERSRFYEAWMRKNQNLDGATDAWYSFMENNPIVTQGKNGALVVNKNNVGNWREYLNGPIQGKAAPAAPSAGSENAIDLGDGFTAVY